MANGRASRFAKPKPEYDLVIVGVGSAGIVAAEFAAAIRLRVAAVEAARIGGDCLWTGCVPSKALLASARVAHQMRTADRFGIAAVEPDVDLEAVWRRIHAIREQIASTDDSPQRFHDLGVEVVFGRARLTGPNTVEVGDRRLETRYVLVATGSRPAVPPVDGLAEAGYVTSETVFELERPPRSLVVMGGGPVGVELAQGCRRLGMPVTLLQRGPRLLPRDEPELTGIVERTLLGEGVQVRLGADARRVSVENGRKIVEARIGDEDVSFEADDVLVAAGRSPTVNGLGLDRLGIEIGEHGIVVDGNLRTSVESVYAVGDVAGRYLFTHNAAHEAATALRDMFYPGSGKPSDLVPWCTFTDPELASVGLSVAEARQRHGDDTRIWSRELSRSDRARAESAGEGAVILVTARGRLVGAHVLAPGAGELIQQLGLAIRDERKLRELAGLIHVYPTVATSIQQLAGEAAYAYARRWARLLRVGGR
jgi:pyruvate/2-oxoglutarate dehydrogenase complex dihydrolipoamide dehydrogenase (E3) component